MKRLLVVVDYQNDFVNGTLGFDGAELLEEPIIELVKSYERNGDEIVFTKDVHGKDYADTEEGKNLPISHCIVGTGGEEFYGGVKRLASRHVIFEKNTFGSARLGTYLLSRHFDVIELCGLDFSICVLANAIIAKSSCPDAHIRILAKYSGCGDPEALEHAKCAARRLHIEVAE